MTCQAVAPQNAGAGVAKNNNPGGALPENEKISQQNSFDIITNGQNISSIHGSKQSRQNISLNTDDASKSKNTQKPFANLPNA